jgi:hypothetical protein
MMSMDVAVHLLRRGLVVLLRCWGLRKVRYGGEGLVLHVVWQVLESLVNACSDLLPTHHRSVFVP